MSIHENHPFHIVNKRPWPLTGAIGAVVTLIGLIKWFHQYDDSLLGIGAIITVLTIIQWWQDVTGEGTYQEKHTKIVTKDLRWGIILLIVSEILFFISFFCAFFHTRLSPTVELGSTWCPTGIHPFNPIQVPLLNTAILLASGVTVTWAHNGLLENNTTQATQGQFFTVLLGLYFTALQAYEYFEAPFTIADSTYGSTFFVATGFHGLHVIIGTTFLTPCLLQHTTLHFSSNHHFGFEAAAWYWHSVNVVWLFLYISIYWWRR
jgi:cytochrome c oxidase subunit 3